MLEAVRLALRGRVVQLCTLSLCFIMSRAWKFGSFFADVQPSGLQRNSGPAKDKVHYNRLDAFVRFSPCARTET